MNNIDKNKTTLEQDKKLQINQGELKDILDQHLYPILKSRGKETVIWDKDAVSNMVKIVNKNLSGITEKKVEGLYELALIGLNKNWAINNQQFELWEKVINKELITDIITEKAGKPWTFLNILNYSKLIQENKQTILSEIKTDTISLVQSKPLGNAGDITINELIKKGIEAIDTPLEKMMKENINVHVTGTFITSMILYRSIVNLYMKSEYSSSLTGALITGSSSRGKEVALFLIMGAPFIAGALLGINNSTSGGTTVTVNIAESKNLEGTGASSGSSSSSLFLFLNKLPNWIKIILKYVALYLILVFITSVIGYKSTILVEIFSQFPIYLGYYLKLFGILNFFVIIYYIWKLYIIVMFAKNKDFINPDIYPNFIKNELLESKDIAVKEYLVNPRKVYKHYLKLISIYIFAVIFGLSVMVLLSSL